MERINTLENAKLEDTYMINVSRFGTDWRKVDVVKLTPKQVEVKVRGSNDTTYRYRKADAGMVGSDGWKFYTLFEIDEAVLKEQRITNLKHYIADKLPKVKMQLTEQEVMVIRDILSKYEEGK